MTIQQENSTDWTSQDHLGYLVGTLASAMRKGLEDELAPMRVTPAQWVILEAAFSGKADTLTALARIIPVDGAADMKNSDCTADFTLSMPDGSQTTINGCLNWSLDAAFEYNRGDPPDVRSFALEFNGTGEASDDCRITIKQEGVCGTGNYLIGEGGVGTTIFTTLDCNGVGDDYQGEFAGSIGYLRLDKIDAWPIPNGAIGINGNRR